MSNYFDNANTNVTRRSYGSNFGKEITRKDLIPVKHRDKADKQVIQESVRHMELSKKVDSTKLDNLKNERGIQKALNEGYSELKDNLVCDILHQICIESLLVDMDPVLENLNTITNMVDSQVAEIGGFEGLKSIAESTGNKLLKNMVKVCEDTAKCVADRNLKTCEGSKANLSFELTDEEAKEFDYKKGELGVDAIVDNVREKVLHVIKTEQKANQEKTEIMDDIKTKLEDAEAPVNEAMESIFNPTGVEEVTLFESLMRMSYKELLENSSSAIFENSYCPQPVESECKEEEYDMSEIELSDDDMEEEIDEDDIEDLMLNESLLSYQPINSIFMNNAQSIIESIQDGDVETLDETLDEMGKKIEDVSEGCKTKKSAKKCKESIRQIQKSTEELQESSCNKKAAKEACGSKNAVKTDELNEEVLVCDVCGEDPCECENIEEGIVVKFREKVNNYFEKSLSKTIAKRDYESVKVNVKNFISQCKSKEDIEFLRKDFKTAKQQFNTAKKHYPEASEKIDDYLNWLETDAEALLDKKEKEIKSGLKEATDFKTYSEGLDITKVRKIDDISKAIRTSGYTIKTGKLTRNAALKIVKSAKNLKELEHCKKDAKAALDLYNDAKNLHPLRADAIQDYSNWLQNTLINQVIPAKEKELKEKAVVESFVNKLDEVCDKLDNVIESHEDAYNTAMESLYVNYNDQKVFAPVINASDCNSDNLHFAYKVKSVCEGLKGILVDAENDIETKQVERMVEHNISNIETIQSAISNKPECGYKYKVLESAKVYLNKINSKVAVLNESFIDAGVEYSSDELLTEAVQLVDSVLESASNTDLIENTRDEQMEIVMAEAITRYTILEAFNTINLINLDKDDVRKMARKNIQ